MDNRLATPAEALVCRANLMAKRCEGSEEGELFKQLAIHLSASLLATREACKERDALAAENAVLKACTVAVPPKVYVKDMRCNVVRWSQVIDALSEAGVAFVRDDGDLIAGARETPATDAAIASFQAQGVEKFADHLLCPDLDKEIRAFAAQLRKGEVK